MDYSDRIREVARQVESRMSQVSGEEATKMSLVAPFIAALGFDVFNPLEVIPEFTADVGIKKGEKVDYALAVNGSPAVLVECKAVGTDLD
ncbi:MAG: hypothetical protein HQ518_25960, partial [Rhodopirellula sp.]|nr:hypothetical protein [Rhodopirellula sp.]